MLVGAQAIYLYTGDADVAIATTTEDSDIALIPIRLASNPTLDYAMTASGFSHDRWVTAALTVVVGKGARPSRRVARALVGDPEATLGAHPRDLDDLNVAALD